MNIFARKSIAVVVSFVIAGIACALAGLCYAELASMLPISGSAYAYTYVTIGEFVAWVIGWLLVPEYALGGSTVLIAWSLTGGAIPFEWCHLPFETSPAGVSGIVNLPGVANWSDTVR